MGRLLPLIILLTLLESCNFMGDNIEYRLQSLYRQRISNSKLVIYDFSFAGGFVTSSDYTGFAVLDSTISFSRDRLKELPCTYFASKPTRFSFKMIDIRYGQNPRKESDTLLTPVKKYIKIVDKISVDITEYNDTYGSAISSTGLMEYEFDGLKETSDSLRFYNVTKKFGGKEFSPTTSFLKGNISVVDSIGGNINYIDVNQVIIKRGDIYKPLNPRKLVHNKPIIGTATYRFYPKKPITAITLTDYGIFKRVK